MAQNNMPERYNSDAPIKNNSDEYQVVCSCGLVKEFTGIKYAEIFAKSHTDSCVGNCISVWHESEY